MTSSDIIAGFAALFSALSLMVSLWAAYKATKLSAYQLRLSNRAELHKMLLEIDREMLHDPSLGTMFKSNLVFFPSTPAAVDMVKQDVFVAMYLNLFELSFSQFKQIKGLTSGEKEISQAWDSFIVYFFEDCPRAKITWARFRETYYSSFTEYIDGLVREPELATQE